MLTFFYRLRRKKGFTLVELIVVIAIVGVLASILVPTFMGYYQNSKISTANSTAASIKKMVEIFLAEMDIQHVGMKRGVGINSQFIFMVKNGQWLVKVECKVNGRNDTDGSLTFMDYKNWWNRNKVGMLQDSTTRSDPNHLLAMSRAVADACDGLQNGFIMVFFSSGTCMGVVYIPECDYIWPQSDYSDIPSSITKGRPQKRPLIVHGRTDPAPRLPEFSPWAGKWPVSANDNFWNGRPGIDKEGYIVGTCPVIAGA